MCFCSYHLCLIFRSCLMEMVLLYQFTSGLHLLVKYFKLNLVCIIYRLVLWVLLPWLFGCLPINLSMFPKAEVYLQGLASKLPFCWLQYSSLIYSFHSILDWAGLVMCLGFSTCILLALTWGGSTKPWSSGAVIGPLCIAGVLFAIFIIWEGRQGEVALVPHFLFLRKSYTGACLEGVSILFSFLNYS